MAHRLREVLRRQVPTVDEGYRKGVVRHGPGVPAGVTSLARHAGRMRVVAGGERRAGERHQEGATRDHGRTFDSDVLFVGTRRCSCSLVHREHTPASSRWLGLCRSTWRACFVTGTTQINTAIRQSTTISRCGFSTAWGALPRSNLVERYCDKIKHLHRVVHSA